MKTEKLGICMLMSYLALIGPIGLLILSILAYAMLVQNLVLGCVTGLLIVMPPILLCIWTIFKWVEMIRQIQECRQKMGEEIPLA